MPRRRFALGRPTWTLLPSALTVLLTAAGLLWALRLGYAPMRYGTAAVILVAVAASLLLGRVADNWPARLVRTAGYALILAEGLFLAHSLGSATEADQSHEKTVHGVPIFGTVLVCCLIALAATTSRRAAVGARTLAIGGGAGAVTGAAVLTAVLLAPPLPARPGWAVLTMAAAGFAAFLVAQKWLDQPRHVAVATLCAVVLTALLLATTAEGLFQFTAHWVPDTSPANVPAADRLANNRDGVEDPYLWILALGFLSSLVLAGLSGGAKVSRISPFVGMARTSGVRVDP
ncbi:hypothetical protein [Streptacidiphilus sp. PAMC 29251]